MVFGPSFIRTVVNKPSLIAVLCTILLAFGIHSFDKLPIEAYPNIAPLNVQVITQWPGRSTLEIERQITIPIETSLAGVPNIGSLRSVSLFGLSVVTIKFKDGTDSFKARQNIQQYLTNANLPTGVQSSLSPDSDAVGEILRYRIDGDNIDLVTIKSYQDWDIYKNIKSVPGVADISGFGGMVKQYQVLPDPEKMKFYGLSVTQLANALANANANVGGDVINSGEQRYVVRGVGAVQSLNDVKQIVIASNSGVPVRIGDVAEIRFGHAPRLGMVQFNKNDDAVEGIVVMRRGQNASEVLARVHEKIDEINSNGTLPKGMKIVPFYDRQNLLDMTTDTVKHTLFVGVTLVLAVLYLFLGNLRAAAAVAAIIPLALCFSFIGMYFFDVPANLISLGAIDFGLIVDSAVIVIENIMTRLERSGKSIIDTVVSSTSEVQRAMVFSTGIIITAYSPLFLLGGVEGKIFQPMGMTMGLALLGSILLSMTFIPSVTAFMFRHGMKPHSPQFIEWVLSKYRPLLKWLIARPLQVVAVSVATFAFAIYTAGYLGTSFLPTLEENNLWIRITLPNTVGLEYSTSISKTIRAELLKQPEVKTVVTQIGRPDDGTDSAGIFNQEYAVYLKAPKEWPAGETRDDLVKRLQTYFNDIPGIKYNFSQYIQDNVAEALSGVKGENAVKLIGTDLDVMNDKAEQIEKSLQSVRGIVDVGIFKELGQPTLNIEVNRENCARFGLNVSDVETLVVNAVGGNAQTSVLEGERTFDLAMRLPEANRNTIEKIGHLLVDTQDGQKIPLSMVANIKLGDGPFFIYRESGKRYIAIKFGVRGRDLGSAVAEAQRVVNMNVTLSRGYHLQWDGQFNQMKEAQAKLAIIIPLTLLVIFLLLYTALGNVKDASVVILNVPFATIGGIAALHLAHQELSISAGIGFLSLFGIAIQDGLILITYVKKLRESSAENLETAVIQGASMRLRPVVMTAMLAGLGLLPAALSHAIGSQAQKPLALVIVGGMVTTTLLTLLVLPVIYSWIHKKRSKSHKVLVS